MGMAPHRSHRTACAQAFSCGTCSRVQVHAKDRLAARLVPRTLVDARYAQRASSLCMLDTQCWLVATNTHTERSARASARFSTCCVRRPLHS